MKPKPAKKKHKTKLPSALAEAPEVIPPKARSREKDAASAITRESSAGIAGTSPAKDSKSECSIPRLEYPLELVARIAAQLLEEERYEEAVRKARYLIFEAWKQENAAERQQKAIAEATLARSKMRVHYKKAFRQITGSDNETDATKGYRDLARVLELDSVMRHRLEYTTADREQREKSQRSAGLSEARIKALDEEQNALFELWQSPEHIERTVEGQVVNMKAEGFSPGEIAWLRSVYVSKFPRRRPKPRK